MGATFPKAVGKAAMAVQVATGTAHPSQNNADLFFSRIGLPCLAANILYQFICRRFAAYGFLVHLHYMKVTMNQKFSATKTSNLSHRC